MTAMTAGAVRLAARYDRFVDRGPGAEPLTDREYEVMRRFALGHTRNRIAADLGISITTVRNHRQHAAAKYPGAASTIDLFRAVGWLRVPGRRTA